MKHIIEILGQSIINYINERTIYKYHPIHPDFELKCVRAPEDLLTYEDDIRKANPYYTCYNGQMIYVRDEEKLYILKDHTNSRSMSSWKAIGEHKVENEKS